MREARPEEMTAIGDLRVAAYEADGFLPPSYAATLRALGADGDGEVLAAVTEGGIAGTVMLQPWPHADEIVREAGEAEIRALAVAPQARGTGMGRALLAAVTQRAVTGGAVRLVLCTDPRMKAARHLYTTAGFRRLPDRDFSPLPGLTLLAYGRRLPSP